MPSTELPKPHPQITVSIPPGHLVVFLNALDEQIQNMRMALELIPCETDDECAEHSAGMMILSELASQLVEYDELLIRIQR